MLSTKIKKEFLIIFNLDILYLVGILKLWGTKWRARMPKPRYLHPEGKLIRTDDGVVLPVIYKDTAIKKGLHRFFTGEQCMHGHVSERKTDSHICLICARVRQVKRHKEKMKMDAAYRKAFLAKRNTRHRERYRSDPEYRKKFQERSKAYRDNISRIKYEEKIRKEENNV